MNEKIEKYKKMKPLEIIVTPLVSLSIYSEKERRGKLRELLEYYRNL